MLHGGTDRLWQIEMVSWLEHRNTGPGMTANICLNE